MVRYFVLGLRTPDVATTLDKTKPFYALPVDDVLNHPMIGEEFSIFKYFEDPSQTVLDIGAHVGFAVSAILSAGCRAAILSFEPNRLHHGPLTQLRERLQGRFDFLAYGLSNKDGKMRFIVPVVEGAAHTTLSTAEVENAMVWSFPENLLTYCLNIIPDVADPKIQFCEEYWPVGRLDELLAHERPAVVGDIAAAKIVAEGHEAEVIEGAEATFARCRPLIMMGGANRGARADKRLRDQGYIFAECRDGRLRITDEMSTRYYGFYLHRDRRSAYVASGMLAES